MTVSVLLALAGLAGTTYPAMAGDFMLEPVSVHLELGQSTQTLSIFNRGQSPVRLQVTGFVWEQTTQSDMKLVPTDDLVFFPQLLDVGAGEHRAVRLGVTAPRDGSIEKTYRIFVEELPSLQSQISSKSAGVAVRVKLGIPIFVDPVKPVPKGEVSIRGMHDGRLSFSLANRGNAHFLAQRVDVIGTGEGNASVFDTPVNGWYVLAGREHEFNVPLLPNECRKAHGLAVVIQTDAGEYRANAPLAAADCKY